MSFTEHLWSGLRRPIRRSIRVKRFICGLCKRTTTLLFYDKKEATKRVISGKTTGLDFYQLMILNTTSKESTKKNEQKGLWYFRLLQTVYQKREAYQKWLKRGREREGTRTDRALKNKASEDTHGVGRSSASSTGRSRGISTVWNCMVGESPSYCEGTPWVMSTVRRCSCGESISKGGCPRCE